MSDLEKLKVERQVLIDDLSRNVPYPEELVYGLSLDKGEFVLYAGGQFPEDHTISLGDKKTIAVARRENDVKKLDPVKLYKTYAHLLQKQAKRQEPVMAKICDFVATELLIDAEEGKFNYSFG